MFFAGSGASAFFASGVFAAVLASSAIGSGISTSTGFADPLGFPLLAFGAFGFLMLFTLQSLSIGSVFQDSGGIGCTARSSSAYSASLFAYSGFSHIPLELSPSTFAHLPLTIAGHAFFTFTMWWRRPCCLPFCIHLTLVQEGAHITVMNDFTYVPNARYRSVAPPALCCVCAGSTETLFVWKMNLLPGNSA